MTTGPVRRALPAEAPCLGAMLARAFAGDAFMRWLARPGEGFGRRLEIVFENYLREYGFAPGGRVDVVEDGSAAAVWVEPGYWGFRLGRQVRLLPQIARVTGWGGVLSRLRGMRAVESHHPADPHFYLLAVGVEPARQGQGLGGAVLWPALAEADARRVPAYLETPTARNLPFYERLGFRTVGEVSIPHGGPLMWLMRREAARV